MRTVIADIEDHKILFEVDIGAVAPNVNDIIVHPDFGLYQVVQRVFILEEVRSTTKIVDITAKRKLETILQIGVSKVQYTPSQEVPQNAAT